MVKKGWVSDYDIESWCPIWVGGFENFWEFEVPVKGLIGVNASVFEVCEFRCYSIKVI